MEPQEAAQGLPELPPGDHRVHKAVLLLVLRPLEALRPSLADGLLNHPGPGKADQRPRLPLALSFADNTDAKMETMLEALRGAGENQGWIGYNRLLETNIRRTTES